VLVQRQIGSGVPGFADGSLAACQFRYPMGISYSPLRDQLYVADTGNHALREIDLSFGVRTIAGDGTPAADLVGGFRGPTQRLNLPFGCLATSSSVFITMAGSHQVWVYEYATNAVRRYAGAGGEKESARTSKELERSEFSEPTGICATSLQLVITDSGSSTVRGIDYRLPDETEVEVLAGGDRYLPRNLFAYGYWEGSTWRARFQGPQGAAAFQNADLEGNNVAYISDTYNHRIRLLQPKTGLRGSRTMPFAGSGSPGLQDGRRRDAVFNEPAGADCFGDFIYIADRNNGCIRLCNIYTREVRVFTIIEEGEGVGVGQEDGH